MAGLLVVLAIAFLGGAPVSPQDKPAAEVPSSAKGEQLTLIDRTDECVVSFPQHLSHFGFNPYPREAEPLQLGATEPEVRERLINAASRWALAHRYLPCGFEMSACLLVDPDGNYGAYIAPTETDGFSIVPEAAVFFNAKTFDVIDEIRFHSPCRQHAATIN